MGSRSKDELAVLIKDYLKSSQVLIVDGNSSARVGLKKLVVSMGAQLHQVHLAGSFEEAEDVIRKQKPRVIFCDYQIDGKYGLDLLQNQRHQFPKESKDSVFILVTSNTSQSAVAQAAEEDVDAFVLKPYTIEGFTSSVSRAIEVKIEPSEYLQVITQGKDLLDKNLFEDALSLFKSAMDKDQKPALACYYEGLTENKMTRLDQSQRSYQKGLTFNKIHYKCLVGLFDLLMSLNEHEAAYGIVQRIVRFFPANPKRLATVLRLAIQTKNYADIEVFYQEFLKMGERGEELTKCVCAALIVCGKYFFDQGQESTALDLVHKGSVSAGGRPYILRKAIETMVESIKGGKASPALLAEVKDSLRRFASVPPENPDYAIATFLAQSLEASSEQIVSRGQELIHRGLNEWVVYKITAHHLKVLGHTQRERDLLDEAERLYPAIKDDTPKEIKNERKKAS